MLKVLMVEDEKLIAHAVRQVLKKENYLVDLAYDGQDGLDQALTGQYDVIVLDILLPKTDGISVLRELRRERVTTPVIMLTAKGETKDKIVGLDNGADDYLAKPFEMDELLARIRALGRRQPELNPGGVMQFGNSSLNPLHLTVLHGGTETKLTGKESQILELLIMRTPMVVSKEMLIEKIWGYDADAIDSNVETQVSLLRKKLKLAGCDRTIRAIRGAGYVLSPAEKGGGRDD
jgi:DNA-binding response OmpR family regulator